MTSSHIVIVTFPAQGHINPSLQFAKCLLKMGIQVTFVTTLSAYRRFSTTPDGGGRLTFAPFSNGYDNGFKDGIDDPVLYRSAIRNRGSEAIKKIIIDSARQNRHVSCVVYTLLLGWAHRVARELHVPSALLWIQPASALDIYYYYFNGYDEIISTESKDPSWSIQLPGLPVLKERDMPSFLLPSNPYEYERRSFKDQIELLDEEENPIVLVNTFDALEPEALQAIAKFRMIAVGPLIPYAFSDGRDPSNNSYGADLFKKNSSNYVDFLNSKQESTVVYISFGSILESKDAELEEIASAILETRRPFLWVIREGNKDEAKLIKYREKLEKQGMIVPWCSQLEVLNHPSLGCFITHCGWNSTLESLACGVPLVAFPHWTDQGTNAKLIEDMWGTGVRVRGRESDGVVDCGEISRCIQMVMGGENKGDGFRRNAMKWKVLGREALKDGGSIDKNLKEFVEGLCDNE